MSQGLGLSTMVISAFNSAEARSQGNSGTQPDLDTKLKKKNSQGCKSALVYPEALSVVPTREKKSKPRGAHTMDIITCVVFDSFLETEKSNIKCPCVCLQDQLVCLKISGERSTFVSDQGKDKKSPSEILQRSQEKHPEKTAKNEKQLPIPHCSLGVGAFSLWEQVASNTSNIQILSQNNAATFPE